MKQKMPKVHKHRAKVKLITRKHVEGFALLRDTLRKLLQIDQREGFEIEELGEAIVNLFFEGGFYICFNPTTGHLAFGSTPKPMARMQSFYI